jgi:hypothetical protein
VATPKFGGIALGLIAAILLAPAMGGCSSDIGLSNVTFSPPKSEGPARKPDWTTFSGNKNEFTLRPVRAEDLVAADGQCAPVPGTVAAGPGEPVLPAGTPTVQGAIVLQMTECDVVRRAGIAEKVDLGRNERGERSVVLTFTRGPWPGIYRFVSGRLFSIERLPAPPPAHGTTRKPAKSSKKPAGT